MRTRIALLALAMMLSAACQTGASDYLAHEKLSVPFDGMRMHDNPSTPYNELIARLKRKAAAEFRGDPFAPAVTIRHVGRNGERMLVSAITPTKGVFYYTEYGPFSVGGGPTVIEPRAQIEVCQFAVTWDALPGGPYAPGFHWAAFAFPDLTCERPQDAALAGAAEWRRRSESASYFIVRTGSDAGFRATLVRERWPGNPPPQPFDGGKAAAVVAGGQDRIARVIPVSEDLPFYVETAAGRTFIGIYERSFGSGGETACIVEGLSWREIASDDPRRRAAAATLCERLFGEYRASSRPGPGEPALE